MGAANPPISQRINMKTIKKYDKNINEEYYGSYNDYHIIFMRKGARVLPTPVSTRQQYYLAIRDSGQLTLQFEFCILSDIYPSFKFKRFTYRSPYQISPLFIFDVSFV